MYVFHQSRGMDVHTQWYILNFILKRSCPFKMHVFIQSTPFKKYSFSVAKSKVFRKLYSKCKFSFRDVYLKCIYSKCMNSNSLVHSNCMYSFTVVQSKYMYSFREVQSKCMYSFGVCVWAFIPSNTMSRYDMF